MNRPESKEKQIVEVDYRIETRVVCYCKKAGVEVLLGHEVFGEWEPYVFIDGDGGTSLELTPYMLTQWLLEPNSFDDPYIEFSDQAEQAVQDSTERCRMLAEASLGCANGSKDTQ